MIRLLWLALLACGTPTPAALSPLPAPPTPHLQGAWVVVGQDRGLALVRGVPADARVVLLASSMGSGGSWCAPVSSASCTPTALQGPGQVLAASWAGDSGIVRLSLPGSFPAGSAFQALVMGVGGPWLSQPVDLERLAAARDEDSDGLSNADELAQGTDPTSSDTDADGLDDAREGRIGTSPVLRDTDHDGLSDLAERRLGSDPLDRDSDADGFDDGLEALVGSDPLDAARGVTQLEVRTGHACTRTRAGNTTCWGRNTHGEARILERTEDILVLEDTSCKLESSGVYCLGPLGWPRHTGTYTDLLGGGRIVCALERYGTRDCRHPDSSVAASFGGPFNRRAYPDLEGECALQTNGQVMCGTVPDQRAYPRGTPPVALADGCALLRDGGVTCWELDRVVPSVPVRSLFVAPGLSCFVRLDTTVACEGPAAGRLRLPAGTGWAHVDGDEEGGCALAVDGRVACWGAEALGLHVGALSAPVRAATGSDDLVCWSDDSGTHCYGMGEARDGVAQPLTGLTVSGGTGCGHRADGAVVCWGDPSMFPKDSQLVDVVLSPTHGCGLDPAGAVSCWGPDPAQYAPPGLVLTELSADRQGTCGVRPSGLPVCFGTRAPTPPAVAVQGVDVGSAGACALETGTGQILCWGPPSAVVGGPVPPGTWAEVAVADDFACARDAAGAVVCWGEEVGVTEGTFVSLSGRGRRICAADVDGGLQCWGARRASSYLPFAP